MPTRLTLIAAAVVLTATLARPASAPPGTVVTMTVQPRPAPSPPLRFVLLPELSAMQPGNSTYGYLRGFYPEQASFHTAAMEGKRDAWLDMPLQQLGRDAEAASLIHSSMLRGLMEAARLDRCDWDLLPRLRAQGMQTLLPDVQKMRSVALWLAFKARVETASGDFPAAVATLQSIVRLARDLGEHPTLVGHLVAAAITMTALNRLEELIQQPGAPNLYWSLTNLPTPLIDLRPGLTGERMLAPGFRPGESADPPAPLTPPQLGQWVERLRGQASTSESDPDVGVVLAARASDAAAVAAARQELSEAGADADRLAQLPPPQVILLDEVRRYEALRDELLAWAALPFHQGWPGLRQVGERARRAGPSRPAVRAELVRRVQGTRLAMARVDRRIATLRAVEAVRLSAAAHNGRLPDTLAALPVPLADDPITGKPLVYRRAGQTFTLSGPPPAGEAANPALTVRYEVTVAK